MLVCLPVGKRKSPVGTGFSARTARRKLQRSKDIVSRPVSLHALGRELFKQQKMHHLPSKARKASKAKF